MTYTEDQVREVAEAAIRYYLKKGDDYEGAGDAGARVSDSIDRAIWDQPHNSTKP